MYARQLCRLAMVCLIAVGLGALVVAIGWNVYEGIVAVGDMLSAPH